MPSHAESRVEGHQLLLAIEDDLVAAQLSRPLNRFPDDGAPDALSFIALSYSDVFVVSSNYFASTMIPPSPGLKGRRAHLSEASSRSMRLWESSGQGLHEALSCCTTLRIHRSMRRI